MAEMPTHVGFILDGNRRWAAANGVPALEGHRRGLEAFRTVSLHAFTRGVGVVSAYVFSTENWQRSKDEVGYLMMLILKGIEKHLEEYHELGIKLVFVGSRDGVPPKILRAIDAAEAKTRRNKQGTLAICFNYGGHQEIVDAAKKLLRERTDPVRLTAKQFEQALYAPEIPPVDLIIRTSGEQRLSGYMLWRAAYAELAFVDTLWPDFGADHLDRVLDHYATRQRRFGV